MIDTEHKKDTALGGLQMLMASMEATLSSLGACPVKGRLERIYAGLERQMRELETAMRNSDTMAERKCIQHIIRNIKSFYRKLGTHG